jgi:hypothetical protein
LIVLIHPPVAKPCEPPAGIAKLAGALALHGVQYYLLDANMEGLLHLLRMPVPAKRAEDAWTKRSLRNRLHNLDSIKNTAIYGNFDRYKRTVNDLGRALAAVSPQNAVVGLADYEHTKMSPLRSADLLAAAEKPESNPFYIYFQSRLSGLLMSKKPAAVGISLNYLNQALCAFAMIGFIRREFPELKVILGGGLVTSWLKNPGWKNLFSGMVDELVAGPGECRLLELLGTGTAHEKYSRPDYRYLPWNDYLSPGFILPYSASTGCYWNKCGFCPEKAEGSPYLPIPVRRVILDLKALAEKTGPALVHLLDNAISPSLLDALANENIGIPWYGFARTDGNLSDPAFCGALKRSGCAMLKLGIESGDQSVLDAMHKGISVDTASIVLKNLKKAGIGTYVYLLFGTPAETEAGATKTLDFILKHSDCINFLNLAIFNMPICGATDAGIETRDFYEGDLSLYTDFVHPMGWDRRRVRLFLEKKFRKEPAISRILKNEPPLFTSNHAPFFV